MDPETLVAARPHYRQHGQDLSFFLSKRTVHRLTPSQAEVWKALQKGPVALKDVPERDAIEELAKAQLIELIEPVREAGRRSVLVVEPHSDDAALSIGATMWKMRQEAEFELLTMASESNYTSSFQLRRDYFNRQQITAMRSIEGELFMRHLGGRYHCAGLNEATLRYRDDDWDLNFFTAHQVPVSISNNRRAEESVLAAWTERFKAFLSSRRFDEIWIPLGAGTHGDHDLARNAALQVIVADKPTALIRLYEDVPYGGEFPEHADRVLGSLAEGGARLSRWFQDVTEDFPRKLSLLSIFASQFKVSAVQPGIERSAGAELGEARVERLWTLDTLPTKLLQDRMWIGAPEVARCSAAMPHFCQGSSTEERLAIFAIGAAGRWAQDLERLKTLFPKARIIVYAGPAVCAEFKTVKDPRVDLHCLGGGSLSWLKAALREVMTGHRIIIAGPAMSKARVLAKIWLTGRKLICSDFDHLIQAAAEQPR